MKQNKKKALTSHFVVAIFVCIFLVFGCQEADDLSDASVQTADTTSPAIVTTSPENGATNVALNISSISATFSEKLDDSELSTSTIILQNGDQAIAGFSYCSNNSINLSPLSNLTGDKTYRVSISTDIKDTAGNSLAAGYSWAFSTGTEVDMTSPTILSVSPDDSYSDVFIDSIVELTFSEEIDPSTITTGSFTLNDGTDDVSGIVSVSGNSISFAPSMLLSNNTNYAVTITTFIKDTAGNPLEHDLSWSFTTGEAIKGPEVVSTYPVSQATYVPFDINITATFSEEIDPSTDATAFILYADGSPVPGTVSFTGQTATFTPANDLSDDTYYLARLTTDIKDLSGDTLKQEYGWQFVTSMVRPTANASADFIWYTDHTISLDGSGSFDPYSNPLTFNWSITSRPIGSTALLSDTTIVNPSLTPDRDGDYELSLVVATDRMDSTIDEVIMTVTTLPTTVTPDPTTGLIWQDDSYDVNHNWSDAITHCSDLELGGFSDWRLPTRNELDNLYDQRDILNQYFTVEWYTSHYWSSTPSQFTTTYAWCFQFYSGDVCSSPKSTLKNVRCVLGGQ